MLKLIRRSPSDPPLLCTSSLRPSLPFLSLSLPFTPAASTAKTNSFTMPTVTLPGRGSALAVTASLTDKKPPLSRRLYNNASFISLPRLNTRTTIRAWPGRVGVRPAWCHSGGMEEQLSPIERSKGLSENEGKEEEDKPIRLNRRQKDSEVLMGSPDLLTIPCVGHKNLRKLVESGIQGVAELKHLYKNKFYGKASQKMVEYLQSSVGIIHRNHAERNISVGKTTFLQRIANETLELCDLVEIVPEPIDKWQNVGPDHFNILDSFYAEPQRCSYELFMKQIG
ncbi:P-loop containing nucleoside triphosphate hydrolases superfamily protein isoform 2 [Hibiscus syriacus]|uniref:P-loop containing nucleoside triphosphate hydrolases superfamily protein isoform 2 n=1 Tax=Hibiscus syriacus TaxID=106335 RepID=A0A6A3BRM0_HIBSY|nr:P-loop containing nucleoside triphosphate hydrolases superfamily protein isoform 2 [Hibiscus syriacus]